MKYLKLLHNFVLAGVFIASAHAQITTARLAGIVKDPTGSVVQNAEVTITNERTGVQRTVRTNVDGLYIIVSLPPS